METKKDYGTAPTEDTIEITLEDLEDVPVNAPQPSQRIYGKAEKVDTIEISWDDLNEPDLPQKKSYGAMPVYNNTAGYEKKGKKIEAQGVVYPLLVGLVGGFVAFLINEPFTNDISDVSSVGSSLVDMGLFLGIIGALISGALSIVDDIKSFVFEKAAKHFFAGAFAGFVTGFIGGIIAQVIFGAMTRGDGGIGDWFARTLGWAIAGTFVGLSQSLVDFKFNAKRLKNGLLGGVIGGAVGGILFDPISIVFGALGNHGAHSGWISRMVGISVMGAAIGCAIGFISESMKEAWMFIVDGPLKGKQFILYEGFTTFGSSPKCSITIVKDPQIAPNHFTIENHGTYYTLVVQAQTYLNNVPVTTRNLRDGDIIIAGQTTFRYEENSLEINKK